MRKSRYKSQILSYETKRPLLIVISGPSGVGKDAVLTEIKKSGYPLNYITMNYHFVSTNSFQKMIKNGALLEWANVYGNWYGVPKEPIKQALDKGQDTIVKVDIQGAATIKKILPQAVFIFLTPTSMEELVSRLEERHTESPADLTLRIKTAKDEIKQLFLFDYVVVNKQGEIDSAVADIEAIITAEKRRVNPREITLSS